MFDMKISPQSTPQPTRPMIQNTVNQLSNPTVADNNRMGPKSVVSSQQADTQPQMSQKTTPKPPSPFGAGSILDLFG